MSSVNIQGLDTDYDGNLFITGSWGNGERFTQGQENVQCGPADDSYPFLYKIYPFAFLQLAHLPLVLVA